MVPHVSPEILWMRHGTCADGMCRPTAHPWTSSPLTIYGETQASTASKTLRIRGWRPALVVSSPVRRARRTAEIVSKVLDAPLDAPDRRFAEWEPPSCVLGKDPTQYPDEYLAWKQRRAAYPDVSLYDGESLTALRNRAVQARALAFSLANQHGSLLIVAHRVIIAVIAGLADGVYDPAVLFANARDFPLHPAGFWTESPRLDLFDYSPNTI